MLNFIFTILKLIATLVCSGIVGLSIVSYYDIFFAEHKYFEEQDNGEYKFVIEKFDWIGLLVVTGFFIPSIIALIYLLK